MQKNLNKELYSDKLFKVWADKNDLIALEEYFIKKYLINKNGKILEAGTGGGRIIFEIEKLGFKQLNAFDYVEKMIQVCNSKKNNKNSIINFKTADATNLSDYESDYFDYLIYLQQVLCFVDKDKLREALNEAYRIGKKNSVYIYSFLNWNSKFYNPVLSILVNLFRLLRNEKVDKYVLPWLNINGAFNWKFLNRNQPQNVWFKRNQVINILEKNGFSILEVKSKVNNSSKNSHIHIACKKVN